MMKKLFYLFILFPSLLIAQNNSAALEKRYNTSVKKEKIEALVDKYKKIIRKSEGIEGWRIQVTFKAKREDILPIQIKFSNLFPEIPAQIIFESPYYKLTVGNFRTRNKAIKIKHQINKFFPSAHPIPSTIHPDLLNN